MPWTDCDAEDVNMLVNIWSVCVCIYALKWLKVRNWDHVRFLFFSFYSCNGCRSPTFVPYCPERDCFIWESLGQEVPNSVFENPSFIFFVCIPGPCIRWLLICHRFVENCNRKVFRCTEDSKGLEMKVLSLGFVSLCSVLSTQLCT